MRATTEPKARLEAVSRRLGLKAPDLIDAAYAPPSWWQELSRADPDAATELAFLVARGTPGRLALSTTRPHRYHLERRTLHLANDGDRAESHERLELLESLWALCPYVASPEARSRVLREYRADPVLIELADLLAELKEGAMSGDGLPAELRRPGDGEMVETATVASRARRLSEEALAQLELGWLPKELARLAEGAAPRFLRALFRLSSASVSLLACYGRAHPRRHAAGASLLAGMAQLERLIEAAGMGDGDPLLGVELDPAEIAIDFASMAGFEEETELAYYRRLDSLGRPASAQEAEKIAAATTKGLNVLLDILDAARRAGSRIEALPTVRLFVGRGRCRVYGHVPDHYFPPPSELAELIALGIDELAAEEDRELLEAFLFAVSTACRPKECCPRREDLAPLGEGHLMAYLDHRTGKTGSRELYVPACAVAGFGISPDWFASRYWADPHPLEVLGLVPRRRRRPRFHRVLPEAETDRARELLEEACRRLRKRYYEETGRQLPDRLAYLTRKIVAAYLWRAPIRPADALADVLGHEDLSGDRPYTRMSESEVLEQNTELIGAARSSRAGP